MIAHAPGGMKSLRLDQSHSLIDELLGLVEAFLRQLGIVRTLAVLNKDEIPVELARGG